MMVKNLSKLLKTSIRFKKLCKSPEEYIQKIHLSISHLNCGKPKKNIVKATNRGKKDTLPSTEQLLLDFGMLENNRMT